MNDIKTKTPKILQPNFERLVEFCTEDQHWNTLLAFCEEEWSNTPHGMFENIIYWLSNSCDNKDEFLNIAGQCFLQLVEEKKVSSETLADMRKRLGEQVKAAGYEEYNPNPDDEELYFALSAIHTTLDVDMVAPKKKVA